MAHSKQQAALRGISTIDSKVTYWITWVTIFRRPSALYKTTEEM
jgi:hypothetical protein